MRAGGMTVLCRAWSYISAYFTRMGTRLHVLFNNLEDVALCLRQVRGGRVLIGGGLAGIALSFVDGCIGGGSGLLRNDGIGLAVGGGGGHGSGAVLQSSRKGGIEWA